MAVFRQIIEDRPGRDVVMQSPRHKQSRLGLRVVWIAYESWWGLTRAVHFGDKSPESRTSQSRPESAPQIEINGQEARKSGFNLLPFEVLLNCLKVCRGKSENAGVLMGLRRRVVTRYWSVEMWESFLRTRTVHRCVERRESDKKRPWWKVLHLFVHRYGNLYYNDVKDTSDPFIQLWNHASELNQKEIGCIIRLGARFHEWTQRISI